MVCVVACVDSWLRASLRALVWACRWACEAFDVLFWRTEASIDFKHHDNFQLYLLLSNLAILLQKA